MIKKYSRVHADVNLDAFLHNVNEIIRKVNHKAQIIAVIKTDGYGHGAVRLAKELEEVEEVWGYAVATFEEGRILRKAGCKKKILLLGYAYPEQYEELIREHISMTVFSYDAAKEIAEIAKRANTVAHIHIKIDTGMNRIGYPPTAESADEVKQMEQLPNLDIEGIFTHFAKADEWDKTATKQQISLFHKMIEYLKERKVNIPLQHISNSAGIVDLKECWKDLVRAGIILYGLWPSSEIDKSHIDLQPVMSIYSQIVLVKEVQAGQGISYGGTYQTTKRERIATIPVGYGDGYPRSLSNKGYVLIRGEKAKIRGRVCMDQFMVDVTDIPQAKVGDVVTLLGRDGDNQITMEEIGDLSGRFNYELSCDFSKRIPRNYRKNGTIVEQCDFFE